MGQSLSRLADWQTDMLADVADAGPPTASDRPAAPDEAVEAARALLPQLRKVQDYVWRRHLAANADRLLAARPAPGDRRELAVGFADLVGYTSRSRGHGRAGARPHGRGLREHRGRGDRPAPRPGGQDRRRRRAVHRGRPRSTPSRSACDLPVAWDAEDRPPLRVGAAYGAVLTRLGDVYSPVVNLASRLTSIARPGTVLVDRELAQSAPRARRRTGCAR